MRRHITPTLALQWAVGLVVLIEALHFALSPATTAHFARSGLPLWIRPALGWVEAAAAILFLLPAAARVGGCGLLLTFAAAVAIHVHLGDYGIGALIVYTAAVVVCITNRPASLRIKPYEPERRRIRDTL